MWVEETREGWTRRREEEGVFKTTTWSDKYIEIIKITRTIDVYRIRMSDKWREAVSDILVVIKDID